MMPEMNGFDVLRALKADPADRDVSVVMHSAWDDPVTREISFRDTETKLSYSALKEVIETLLKSSDAN
jgi:CheY-like chemotaxis protein